MRVNIIGKSNGVGLTRDARLLTDALRAGGCEVTLTTTGSRESGRRKSLLFKGLRGLRRHLSPLPTTRFDINVMLEHVWTQFAPCARMNVAIPNPDFFDRHDVAALSTVDRIWAKTRHAERLFQARGTRVDWIGFDSEDRLLETSSRMRTCFHLAGSSVLKGTQRLLEVWAQHPEWPVLLVVGRLKTPIPEGRNIQIFREFLDDHRLKRMQNESVIHVCTSETEGWGHYLVEAMSVKAAVITVDAPPMNELIDNERGWLLSCRPNGMHRLAQRYIFDPASLIATMEQINAMPEAGLIARGERARQWFETNSQGFPGRIRAALNQLRNSADVA